MITLGLRTVLHCTCERPQCKHEWDSFGLEKPLRCPKCKYRRIWNGEDHRRPDPFEHVRGALVDDNVPQLSPKELLTAFTDAKKVLEDVIRDLGPCDHQKEICICPEQKVLDKVTKQITALAPFNGGKPKPSAKAIA